MAVALQVSWHADQIELVQVEVAEIQVVGPLLERLRARAGQEGVLEGELSQAMSAATTARAAGIEACSDAREGGTQFEAAP
jgi:hypothetical protein